MFWYSLLAVVGVLFLLSVALPVPRRVWAFSIYSLEVLLAVGRSTSLGLRRLWFKLTGKDKYRRLDAPGPAPHVVRGHGADLHQVRSDHRVVGRACSPTRTSRSSRRSSTACSRSRSSDVKRTLDEELGAEKAAHLVDIEPKQLASASIAQVHTAEARDGTQRRDQGPAPRHRSALHGRHEADARSGARSSRSFAKNAELANPVGVIDDFTDDADRGARLPQGGGEPRPLQRHHARARAQATSAARSRTTSYTTRKVLVMERFNGLRVDRFDEIRARGIDGESKLVDGLRAWFQCVVFYGFFHGDVHAGNLMLLDDDDHRLPRLRHRRSVRRRASATSSPTT